MHQDHQCPVCRERGGEVFLELLDMPVSIGVQWPDVHAARKCKKGDLRLSFCPVCGFIWNSAFDPSLMEYSTDYENSLHFSPLFQGYTEAIVERLVRTYDLEGRAVIDIGCGKGDFLAMLCEGGAGKGIGFDPSYEGERILSPARDRLTFVQDLYSEKYTDVRADLITSRFVFEHIENPVEFLRMVRSTIDERHDTVVYFEVPNVRLILERLSVWDIIYEHCSYFGAEALTAVFEICGFDVLGVREGYDAQFLSIEAKLPEAGTSVDRREPGDLSRLAESVRAFRDSFALQVENWGKRLDVLRFESKRIVAWGAGAKAVGFLNMMKIDDFVPYVVDINPHKHGFHLAGTGQKVVPPKALLEYGPDVVIVMNPIYRDEISRQISDMGLSVDLIEAS